MLSDKLRLLPEKNRIVIQPPPDQPPIVSETTNKASCSNEEDKRECDDDETTQTELAADQDVRVVHGLVSPSPGKTTLYSFQVQENIPWQ